MEESLSCFTVGTPKCALFQSDAPGAGAPYKGFWVGRTSLSGCRRLGCQQFVDVISPVGRRAPIGITGLVLAEDDVPFDWTAFLLPLVHAESFAAVPEFADPFRIGRNRDFIRHACTPGSSLPFEYADPAESDVFELSNPFLVSEAERKREIVEMLDFLEGKDPHFFEAELLTAMQEALFGTASWIASRLGRRDWFQQTFEEALGAVVERPRELAIKEFLRLRVDGDRLIERTSREREHLASGAIEYDVFLSHFHGDLAAADALVRAITQLLPSVRIFRSKATEEEQRVFEKYPVRFLEAARRSRCLVHLATPNSLGRAFVRQELGNNALRPIFTVLVGISPGDFDHQRRRELHVAYQTDRIYKVDDRQEWQRFLDDLEEVVGRGPRDRTPGPLVLTPGPPSPRDKQEEGDSFLEWARLTRSRSGGV